MRVVFVVFRFRASAKRNQVFFVSSSMDDSKNALLPTLMKIS